MSSQKTISLSLFRATEYLCNTFNCYEGITTVRKFLDGFSVEANSDQIDEKEKSQRDVSMSDPRVNSMCEYLDRDETAFTGIIIFVTKLVIEQSVKLGEHEAVLGTIPLDAESHITDGQGRHTAFTKKLDFYLKQGVANEMVDKLLNRTLGLKLIVTNTETIAEARDSIRNFFSDIHLTLRKPNTSLSIYFSSAPVDKLCRDVCNTLSLNGQPLINRIAVNGKIKQGQIWDLLQFRSFVLKIMGATPAAANKDLAIADSYDRWREILLAITPCIFKTFPLHDLDSKDWRQFHDKALFTKALYAQGLGYLARSVIDEALDSQMKLNYLVFDKLANLPQFDLGHQVWVSQEIAHKVDKKTKITPKCDLKIGAFLCRELRVYPCRALTA
ncbi:DGQHR domain-containing protein [Vibrio harveyi]|uniref:DGQHR domain-containing protein n=1 Tax=Vibrio harveyi TaxID=669 RepID=UPI00248120B6|nr:DGQHR domain-containing protein [Vibrio harveyi]